MAQKSADDCDCVCSIVVWFYLDAWMRISAEHLGKLLVLLVDAQNRLSVAQGVRHLVADAVRGCADLGYQRLAIPDPGYVTLIDLARADDCLERLYP